jgi:hypothetical protein
MPIQIDSMDRLLAERRGRHDDGGVLRGEHDRGLGNFSATLVRFYFASPLTASARACSGLPLRAMTLPMALLHLSATHLALAIMTAINTVDVPMVAIAT